jgi:hypothetical protein
MSANETGDRPETIPRDENRTARAPDGETDRFLDEELIPILVVGGFVLVLFPEPVTSALGLVLVATGVGLWLRDLLS